MSTATLHTRLDETKTGLTDLAPAELLDVFAAEQVRLEATTDRTGTVQVGDVVPDVTLPDAHGKPVQLADLVADGPAVVVFYRGAWCPYCNVALKAYQDEVLPTLEALNVPLVAVSPQGPDGSLTIAEKNALAFPVLTDQGSALARQLGLVVRAHRRGAGRAAGVRQRLRGDQRRRRVGAADADRAGPRQPSAG